MRNRIQHCPTVSLAAIPQKKGVGCKRRVSFAPADSPGHFSCEIGAEEAQRNSLCLVMPGVQVTDLPSWKSRIADIASVRWADDHVKGETISLTQ